MTKRHTKIICTLGPATREPDLVRCLIEEGMDYARLNFSHGIAEDHVRMAQTVREAARGLGRPVKILQDLQGPKPRIGRLSHPLHFRAGDKVILAPASEDSHEIPIADPEILEWIRPGDAVFLDDGAVELEALEKREGRIEAVVRVGGRVDSRSGIHLPGGSPRGSALSEKDKQDIQRGRAIGVDLVAQSMVRNRSDIDRLRSELGERTPIVAKIENAEALRDLDRIADASWGIMVARGDLGVSIPRAEVPLRQKEILAICRRRGRFGIVATEMMLSMVKNDRPTRAEVSDVAAAVIDGADAVMLSEETAIGAHPVEAVREMRQVVETVEASRWYPNPPPRSGPSA